MAAKLIKSLYHKKMLLGRITTTTKIIGKSLATTYNIDILETCTDSPAFASFLAPAALLGTQGLLAGMSVNECVGGCVSQ